LVLLNKIFSTLKKSSNIFFKVEFLENDFPDLVFQLLFLVAEFIASNSLLSCFAVQVMF